MTRVDQQRIAAELTTALHLVERPRLTDDLRHDALYHVSLARLLLTGSTSSIIPGPHPDTDCPLSQQLPPHPGS